MSRITKDADLTVAGLRIGHRVEATTRLDTYLLDENKSTVWIEVGDQGTIVAFTNYDWLDQPHFPMIRWDRGLHYQPQHECQVAFHTISLI